MLSNPYTVSVSPSPLSIWQDKVKVCGTAADLKIAFQSNFIISNPTRREGRYKKATAAGNGCPKINNWYRFDWWYAGDLGKEKRDTSNWITKPSSEKRLNKTFLMTVHCSGHDTCCWSISFRNEPPLEHYPKRRSTSINQQQVKFNIHNNKNREIEEEEANKVCPREFFDVIVESIMSCCSRGWSRVAKERDYSMSTKLTINTDKIM